jgi:hypothetical protein
VPVALSPSRKEAASATTCSVISCFSTIRSRILPLPLSASAQTSLPSTTTEPLTHQFETESATVPPIFFRAFS